MSILSSELMQARRISGIRRVLFAVLLTAAFALVVLAGSARDAQADVGIQANYNYVTNGSFETGPALPANWLAGALGAGDKRICTQSYAGACSFKMAGDNTSNYIFQDIPLIGTNAGDEWKLKVATKGKALDFSGVSGQQATIYVQFFYGTSSVNYERIDIPSGTTAWSIRQVNATADADYTKIRIIIELDALSGKAWFDQIKLLWAGD